MSECVTATREPFASHNQNFVIKEKYGVRQGLAHSGIEEMPKVTADEVSSDLWMHRAQIKETFNNCGSSLLP